MLGGELIVLFGGITEAKLAEAPKGSVLVFERVTAGAALNGSEVADVSFDEKFADQTDEPNGSKVVEEDTEAVKLK